MRAPGHPRARRDALRRLSVALAAPMVPAFVVRAQGLPEYQRVDKLAGTVKGSGSSTVAALLRPIADRFRAAQPELQVELAGAGSSTALAAMLADPDTLGLLSRPLLPRERKALLERHGGEAVEVKIAVDALAVYVFKRNPVPALSLADLRRAFGREPDAATHWGQLGVAGDSGGEPIVRFGLERGRGAHELFRDIVLEGGDFAPDIAVEPVSTSVVQGVATHAGGIGYASVYFRTARTRVLPLLHRGEAVEPTAGNALSGRYPLARFLYLIVPRRPDAPASAATRQFLAFVLSRDGQRLVEQQGLFALDADVARAGLRGLDLPAPR